MRRAIQRGESQRGKRLEKAVFRDRNVCIGCGGGDLKTLSQGKFSDKPLFDYLKNDPWGVSPIPYIEDET